MKTEKNVKGYRKENHFKSSYIIFTIQDGKIKEVAELRIYSTPNIDTAILWIDGTAKGVGKSKFGGTNGASKMAIQDAGFEINGGANTDYQMQQVAQQLGVKTPYIYNTHG